MNWTQALNDFSLYLKIERGLSLNSISSYKNDVKKLVNFLAENDIAVSPVLIEQKTIQEFIYTITKK